MCWFLPQYAGFCHTQWEWVIIIYMYIHILLFTASDLASITSHVHNWVLLLLWLHPFILSGVISPLISSTYWPGEFLFQYPIFFSSHVCMSYSHVLSCMDVRVGLWRKLRAEKLMPLNCSVGEDSWESLGLQGSILKEISPGCSLEGLMLKLTLQYFGHLMWRVEAL